MLYQHIYQQWFNGVRKRTEAILAWMNDCIFVGFYNALAFGYCILG